MVQRITLLSFSEFFEALIEAFNKQGLRLCVLRNYGSFPARNAGRDIDLLILPTELPRAHIALQSIRGIQIVGYTERSYVASFFLSGVSSDSKARSLQIDCDLSLTWKGLPYLPAQAVLEAAIPRQAGNLTFYTPCSVHEAILSLLASLLVGGWLKEKYLPMVQETFTRERSAVIATLSPDFGVKGATRLVDSVIGGDRQKVLGYVRSLRWSLVLRNCMRRPVRSIWAVCRHHVNEFAFRYSAEILQTVRIVGLDESEKKAVIEYLIPILQSSAVLVEERDFRPKSFPSTQLSSEGESPDLQTRICRGRFGSVASVLRWLQREWARQLLGNRNLTLRISGNNYCDLLIAPPRCGYAGPMWFARLVGKFFPPTFLWVLLQRDSEKSKSINSEPSSPTILKQREAYVSFIRTRRNYVILDTGIELESIAENAYSAIVDSLARRTGDKLKIRF